MRCQHLALLVFLLATIGVNAQAPPPPTCPGAISPQPSHLRITYLGSVSGCTETTGVCLPGETIQFTAVHLVDFNCPLVANGWNFVDGTPLVNGQTVAHVFVGPGSYEVELTVAVLSSTATITQRVVVAGAPIPALDARMLLFLTLALAGTALVVLRR